MLLRISLIDVYKRQAICSETFDELNWYVEMEAIMAIIYCDRLNVNLYDTDAFEITAHSANFIRY